MKAMLTPSLWPALLLAALFCCCTATAQAQKKTIEVSGTVLDKADQSPLVGATVTFKGDVSGVFTDQSGNFSIKTQAAPPVTLIINYLGYQESAIQLSEGQSGLKIELSPQALSVSEVTITANRVEEKITKSPVTVEKLSARTLQAAPGFDSYAALQGVKGVDLLSQSLTFRSVNIRGFGANNNNRFVQLTDGMDNRSGGLGFGFGNVAGASELDIESIEILPGASSALYGPDALQGLMLTNTKSPFKYQGVSAQVKTGANNFGKADFDPKLFTDIAFRYAGGIGKRLAFKVNLQAINGTDFIADDYEDRSTRGRRNFFTVDQNTKKVGIGYVRNNNPGANFEYDGVNIYGDDVTNGGAFDFPANAVNTALQGRRVTRTGYSELDLLGNDGKIFSYRANAAVHFKVNDKVEAIGAWYYGNGNFIRTAGFREYFPDYRRNQFKLELRGEEFFVRAYHTTQQAEGFNLGVLAQRILGSWKSTGVWANDFANAFTGDIARARAAADTGKPLPGTAAFDNLWNNLTNTLNTQFIPGSTTLRGVRLLDNSKFTHAEGSYNFKKILPEWVEVITGASYRKYNLLTKGTIFPATADGSEFTITEYGAYLQGSVNLTLGENASFRPTAAVRYDKNEYFKGGLTPRLSGVLSLGEHNFRASWQSAFRNPSPNQLLADGKIGEVGGSETALRAANLFNNPAYTEASAKLFQTSGNTAQLVKYEPKPEDFTTEKIKTWELGYKTLIGNRLYVDAFYFQSVYNDFIATQNYYQPISGNINDLRNASTYRTYQINFNNFNEIYVNGYGVGVEYAFWKTFSAAFNFANQIGKITLKDNAGVVRKDAFGQDIVKRKMSDLEVSQVGRNFFISPENRFNVTVSNPYLTKRIGFVLSYRWTDETWIEQGNTQGDVLLPAWNSVDAALTYKLPAIKGLVKLGGTNIFNQYFSQGYGLAQIGGLYYVSLLVDGLGSK